MLNESDWLRIGVFVLAVTVLTVAELVSPLRTAAPGRVRRLFDNWSLMLVSNLLLRLLVPLTLTGAAFWAQARGYGVLNAFGIRFGVAFVVALVALDFALYLQHLAFHTNRFLWRLHRVHHSARDLDLSVGVRFHPLEYLASLLFKMLVVIALGAPPVAVLAFEIILNAFSLFGHANLGLPAGLDRTLRALIVTPRMHWLHHGEEIAHSRSNFGFCLSLWDRLLGTYHAPPDAGSSFGSLGVVGLEHDASGVAALIRQPLLDVPAADDYRLHGTPSAPD